MIKDIIDSYIETYTQNRIKYGDLDDNNLPIKPKYIYMSHEIFRDLCYELQKYCYLSSDKTLIFNQECVYKGLKLIPREQENKLLIEITNEEINDIKL